MNFKSFSLNGNWYMNYTEDKYIGKENPWEKGELIEAAVPGYWEDMTDKFQMAEFFGALRINPEYGVQRYPIAGTAPDMALPNVVGNFFYMRKFSCENFRGDAFIHFEGVQNALSLWINDIYLGRHEGYSTPFDMPIPDGLLNDGENTIVLSVSNHRLEGFDGQPVSGLTSRAANEYTGGITGDIELRVYTSPLRDIEIKVSDDLSKVSVNAESSSECRFDWTVLDGEAVLKQGSAGKSFCFDTDGLEYWSPESPILYTLKIESGEGSIERKFGVRRLTVDGVHFRLNGKPYYLRGICEHCYFPMTVHPHHDIAEYRKVIKTVKALGFNYIRFHTFVPAEEYMQAADEFGILVHIESPNNTSFEEWREIVTFCRRHTSTVIYCCGNELQIHDDFQAHINKCADEVHARTDSLFSPMSALRGFEYVLQYENEADLTKEPFLHNPKRFEAAGRYCDLYNSYTLGHNSYYSIDCDHKKVDSWSTVYNKPRLSHEICIDGTFTDLSVKERYKGTRIGGTDMFDSIERHLDDMGVLANAPIYFKNSSEWQRRNRKYCFECVRLSENLAGYDFLGPIDTHWHTFGYDVGMMNEFYELKPGESVRNVLMYNSPTVLLTDLGLRHNFTSGENISFEILASHYGQDDIHNAALSVKLIKDGRVALRCSYNIDNVENGKLQRLTACSLELPEVQKPTQYKLYITLDAGDTFAENEWEIYVFPNVISHEAEDVVIAGNMGVEELKARLKNGEKVLFIGNSPFNSNETSFRISLAGRTSGNTATVISDHPVMNEMPHEGFCSWQFEGLLRDGKAVCFADKRLPFDPIVEVVSTHKCFVKQAALFEFNAFSGKALVCTFDFKNNDPAAVWLKDKLISYACSDEFEPKVTFNEAELDMLANGKVVTAAKNTNFAMNPNDKTAVRKR